VPMSPIGSGPQRLLRPRRRIAIFVVFVLAIVLADVAAAAASRKWYWPQSRAEAMVVRKVRIPDCWFSGDARCTNPPGAYWASGGPRWKPSSVECTGADEYRTSFNFSRFACKIVIADYYGRPLAHGVVAMYVTGAATMRWKLIG
jgi:hypothetical protein